MTPPAVGQCTVCRGQGRVYRAPINAPDLEVGHVDFGRDYPCPRCHPAQYNAERGRNRWER